MSKLIIYEEPGELSYTRTIELSRCTGEQISQTIEEIPGSPVYKYSLQNFGPYWPETYPSLPSFTIPKNPWGGAWTAGEWGPITL